MASFCYSQDMRNVQYWIFSDEEKRHIKSIVAKGRAEESKNDKFSIIDIEAFYSLFNEGEIAILQKWRNIDPKNIGYKLPYLSAKDIVDDLVSIDDQTFDVEGQLQRIPCQYLPGNVYEALQSMNEAMAQDLGKQLLVLYGHRSLAHQMFIFFDILEGIYNYDFDKTMRRVCLPDYSEHVCTQRQAIDFKTQDATSSDDFDKTDEYVWLKNSAHKYRFFESYPKDNKLGMMYEPWHWHYEALV